MPRIGLKFLQGETIKFLDKGLVKGLPRYFPLINYILKLGPGS